MTPEIVLGDVAAWRQLYLAARPSHVAANVDGLACPLHHPMAYSRQMMGHSFLSCTAMPHGATVGSGAFQGGGV
jgi:hypothetical protein